jgi:hypothetical protein
MKDVGAEAGAGADGGHAGAVELLVVAAEGAGGERGGLAEATIGFSVAAEWIVGVADFHFWFLPERRITENTERHRLNGNGRKRVACGHFLIHYFNYSELPKLRCQLFWIIFLA